VRHAAGVFVVIETGGELSAAAVELRRLFPGIEDMAKARPALSTYPKPSSVLRDVERGVHQGGTPTAMAATGKRGRLMICSRSCPSEYKITQSPRLERAETRGLFTVMTVHALQHIAEESDRFDQERPLVQHDTLGTLAHRRVGRFRAAWTAVPH
jgi:hypothetical protein